VTVPELFGYDIYLRKTEGALLTVGCARDNNIVLPHSESRRHLLKLYYAQGQAWVEDKGSTQQALIEGIPLTGTRCLKQGATLEVGEARIELITE
ncbi:MAG: FHA domain-containing protein, partial [Coriobacteriales bacterium]|nr:FHA domain-containing protein [Coriobacteriales bacterium]